MLQCMIRTSPRSTAPKAKAGNRRRRTAALSDGVAAPGGVVAVPKAKAANNRKRQAVASGGAAARRVAGVGSDGVAPAQPLSMSLGCWMGRCNKTPRCNAPATCPLPECKGDRCGSRNWLCWHLLNDFGMSVVVKANGF